MNTRHDVASQTQLIFACSGASDVGEIADLAARQLAQQGVGRMFCLAGLGGDVPAILKTTRTATTILAIDGCQQECARKTLERVGCHQFLHLQLEDLGLTKGDHPPTAERVDIVVRHAREMLT